MASSWRKAYDIVVKVLFTALFGPLLMLWIMLLILYVRCEPHLPVRLKRRRRRYPRVYNSGPPLPPRPPPRLRPVTPTDDTQAENQVSSLFFSCLPSHIRRMILVSVFGSRTMHIDMFYGPARKRVVQGGFWPQNLEVGEVPHNGFWVEKSEKKPRWHWTSSVCHRNPPLEAALTHRTWSTSWITPDRDKCADGSALCCAAWSDNGPRKCSVGALGWLMSCRQAYAEGIDILYGTNTFHIKQQSRLFSIHRFIHPVHRPRLSRFEAVLIARPSSQSRPDLVTSVGLAHLYYIMASCYRVERLHITFEYAPGRYMYGALPLSELGQIDVGPILKEMDDILKALTTVEGVVLEFKPSAMEKLERDASSVEERELPHNEARGTFQLWRCLDDGVENARIERRLCLYPEQLAPPRVSGSPEMGYSRGYWIIASPVEENGIVDG